jgi:DNA-binding NarL/FixJ family response regulator
VLRTIFPPRQSRFLCGMLTGIKKLVVLIVDDSPLIVERFIEILNEMDNIESVAYAHNYTEGARLIDDIQPDIALLDINLPGKSGIELLRRIHQERPEMKVIMITNQATEQYRNICSSLGADYFFDKSKEFEQIPNIISNIHLN